MSTNPTSVVTDTGVLGEPDEPDLFTEKPLDSPPDQSPPAL
jgi:hypothetical protein